MLYELANRDGAHRQRRRPRTAAWMPAISAASCSASRRTACWARAASDTTARQSMLTLTEAGRAAFAPLDAALARGGRRAAGPAARAGPGRGGGGDGADRGAAGRRHRRRRQWRLRAAQPGDIGWVVARHGALYAGNTASMRGSRRWWRRSPAAFLASHDPARERCWIAEHDGVNLASVFLVRADDDLARLRLLLVEPSGARRWASASGWWRSASRSPGPPAIGGSCCGPTTCCWPRARHLYVAAGFRLVASKPHQRLRPGRSSARTGIWSCARRREFVAPTRLTASRAARSAAVAAGRSPRHRRRWVGLAMQPAGGGPSASGGRTFHDNYTLFSLKLNLFCKLCPNRNHDETVAYAYQLKPKVGDTIECELQQPITMVE